MGFSPLCARAERASSTEPLIFLDAFKPVRRLVFWPPVILLVGALAFSLADFHGFHAAVSGANSWILRRFDWLFSYASFAAVLLLIWIWLSPLGAVRIGGPDAKPLLSRWNWFAITLCTTIAIGILFWGTAEPMFHFNGPPEFSGAAPRSPEAARFAIASLFMHWTITPYAIYTVPALAFALTHYNLGVSYSLSGPLSILLGKAVTGRFGAVIDAVGLYALVAGVAASLGAGVMTVAGGLNNVAGWDDGALLRLGVTAAIVIFFVASSITGIQRGIKYLSDLNIKIFFVLCAFVLIAGPTGAILAAGAQGLVDYAGSFIPRSLSLGARGGDPWTRDWTVFYFANWLAWAPITALFLGRISVGYSVREFLLINLVAPSAFGAFWMSIFGGAAIHADLQTAGSLTAALDQNGPEAVVYALFDALPFAGVVVSSFVLITFISFVTAMDSNTHSIAGICVKESAAGAAKPRTTIAIKIFWGALIGAIAWVMTATTGIDGVRMLSNLGGLPGLFLLIGMGGVLVVVSIMKIDKLNVGAPKQNLKSASSETKAGNLH